jgi:hypothetical protein
MIWFAARKAARRQPDSPRHPADRAVEMKKGPVSQETGPAGASGRIFEAYQIQVVASSRHPPSQ